MEKGPDKVAVITGGSRGLGLAIAKELQARGFALMLVGLEKELTQKVRREMTDEPEVRYLSGDITLPGTAQEIARVVNQHFGRLDLLVNNAGIFMMGGIIEFSSEDWDRIMSVNCKGAFLVTKHCVDLLKKSEGQIVFINSVGGRQGLAQLCGYSASKFALLGLADSLRLELKPDKIRVTSIFPHNMNSAGEMIGGADPKRWQMIETADVARMVGEVADSPRHVQIPEIVIYPRSTEISKQETD